MLPKITSLITSPLYSWIVFFIVQIFFFCKYRFRIEVINSTANLAVKLEIAVLIWSVIPKQSIVSQLLKNRLSFFFSLEFSFQPFFTYAFLLSRISKHIVHWTYLTYTIDLCWAIVMQSAFRENIHQCAYAFEVFSSQTHCENS